MRPSLDIIGDVHGELPALEALGRELGYDVANDWHHPEARFPIFVGDLVDRGAHSYEVAKLVMDLASERRAVCLMGNHEYNLVAHHLRVPGYEEPKPSNGPTIDEIQRSSGNWKPILAWFRDLPLGLDLPDLRIIHACWHRPSLEVVGPVLSVRPGDASPGTDVYGWVMAHVALRSPFTEGGLIDGLPGDTADKRCVIPHEDLMKGFEVPAPEPFVDNDGKRRSRIRAVWWRDHRDLVLADKPQVFGHYWNCPPIAGNEAPPHPSGHPELRKWGAIVAEDCPPAGKVAMSGNFACVDFHGITRATDDRACIGALRWPEREIVWAMGRKTAKSKD